MRSMYVKGKHGQKRADLSRFEVGQHRVAVPCHQAAEHLYPPGFSRQLDSLWSLATAVSSRYLTPLPLRKRTATVKSPSAPPNPARDPSQTHVKSIHVTSGRRPNTTAPTGGGTPPPRRRCAAHRARPCVSRSRKAAGSAPPHSAPTPVQPIPPQI